jgi:hypothetical protein
MKIITKILLRVGLVIALLVAGFAAGFPVGKSIGFTTGSEWAFVQADIAAREMGTNVPVYFRNGQMRVIIKQPRNIYKQAWQLADRYQKEMEYVNKGEKPLTETAYLFRNLHITR